MSTTSPTNIPQLPSPQVDELLHLAAFLEVAEAQLQDAWLAIDAALRDGTDLDVSPRQIAEQVEFVKEDVVRRHAGKAAQWSPDVIEYATQLRAAFRGQPRPTG